MRFCLQVCCSQYHYKIYAEVKEDLNLENQYVLEDNEKTLFFESQEAMERYALYTNNEVNAYSNVTWNEVLNNTTIRNDGWIGTLTNDWIYSSSYTLTKSTNYSATLSGTYNNVSFSVGASKSFFVAVTLSADASRRSKLAIWQTYTIKNYTITYYVDGMYWKSDTYNSVTKSGDATIGVCYIFGSKVCGNPL